MRRIATLGLALILAATAAPAAARGFVLTADAPGSGVEVRPDPATPRSGPTGAFLELGTIQPGVPISDAVIIRSNLSSDREVLLYPADAVPARGGGFGYDASTDPAEQAGRWLALASNKVIVPAHGQVRVALQLLVPPGTPGGEYVGGIVAEPTVEVTQPGVQTLTRFAMSVYFRVPGGLPGATPGRGEPGGVLVIKDVERRFEGSRACVTVILANESQDILDPDLAVVVSGPLGGGTASRTEPQPLLPGTTATIEMPCTTRPLGPSELRVTVTTPRGTAEATSTSTWLPWQVWVASLFLLLLLLALLLVLLKRRSREEKDEDEDEDS